MRAYVGVLLAVLMWGASFQIGMTLSKAYSPWMLTAWRYTLAAPLLVLCTRVKSDTARPVPPRLLPLVILAALLGHLFFSVAFFAGVHRTDPVVAAIISSLEPVVATLLSVLFYRNRPSVITWTGMAVAAAGAILISAHAHDGYSASTWRGAACMFLSTVLFGGYVLLNQRLMRFMPPMAATAATMRWSVPFAWLGAALFYDRQAPVLIAMPDLPGLLFFAMGVTVAAFIGWNSSLNQLGVARTVVWMNGVPVVGLLVSMSLGHRVALAQLCGLAMVLVGVFIIHRGSSSGRALRRRRAAKVADPRWISRHSEDRIGCMSDGEGMN